MKVTTFTDTMIKKLKPEEKKYTRSEGNGFTIRIMPSGVKSWLYLFNFDGNRLEMNFGIYPVVSLETARQKFEDAKKKVKNGINPKEEEENNAEARRKAPTVADLIDDYINKHAKKFKKSWKDDERLLNKEIIAEAKWGKRKAADITKRDMTLLLESIVDRGTPAMSNQVLKIVRKMFNFAVERDILQHTPCTGVKALAPNTSRERTLNESEIKTLWGKLNNAAVSDEIKGALKLILITAQRPGEVTGMHTSEIDGQWWTIPAERSKNGKEHRVYLTATALEIITEAIAQAKKTREMPADAKYSGYIFPCPHKKKIQSIDSHALPVAVRRNLAWPLNDDKGKPLYLEDGTPATENRLGVDQFTPHDLRRTAATFMGGMGYMDEIIDAILNHVKQGIIRTYNRHGYDKEKQEALESWEKKLTTIVS
ncbi:MAG TPA: site-specific integrase [Desulfuromonadales bacterium]|nr:site-specific integrase [Desulfuromonadales bacterium]